jgi:hypothetical protein
MCRAQRLSFAVEQYLFNEYDLRLVMDAHEGQLLNEIQEAPEEHVLQVDVDAWAAALVAKWRLDCPQLSCDGMYQDDPEPCQVDVSRNQGRYARRKESIVNHRQHLAETGLPTKPRTDAPKTYVADAIERRPSPPAKDMSLQVPLPLEPVVSDEMYEDIVGTLRNTAVCMERSVGTYVDMREEDLRQVMLLPLADRYRGQATARDLQLRRQGRSRFALGRQERLRCRDENLEWREIIRGGSAAALQLRHMARCWTGARNLRQPEGPQLCD